MSTDAAVPPFAEALGRVPSGLFIVTVRHEEQETGMLASWIMQAGFEPPAVTIAVRRDRYLADWLSNGTPLVVNIIADNDKSLLKQFGKGFAPGEPAFDGVEITRSPQNMAILAAALGHLECEVTGNLDTGDHRIVVAKVVGGRMAREGSPAVHVRKNGLRY